jgi:putative tryptophan/tyrosine transport system substrate-binding protein
MNMWRRRGLQFSLGFGLLCLIILCGCQNPFTKPPLVGIILWNKEIQSLDDNLRGVVEGLREEGYLDGLNLRLQVVNSTMDRGRAAVSTQELEEQGARVLVTLGDIPTMVALNSSPGSKLPIVYSGVASPSAAGLNCQPGVSSRLTGTSMEVPASEQIRVFMLARPRLTRLGILFCTACPEAVATGGAAEIAARNLGLRVITATVTDERPELLERALTIFREEKVEAVFMPTDSVLASPRNLELICRRLLQARVPLMVPFESSVSYGALLSYHADFAEVGRQAGRQAGRILAGVSPREVSPEIPRVKRLTLNLRTAQALGLPLSRHLLSRAQDLY